MAVDPTQLIQDAQCILACIPPGMVPSVQLGQMVQPSIVTTTLVTEAGATPVLLLAANPKRRRAVIQNIGQQCNIGPFAAPLFLLAAGANNATSRIEVFTQGELYVTGTAGQTLSVIEFLVP